MSGPNGANSPNSPGGNTRVSWAFPPDSILADALTLTRTVAECDDPVLLAPMLALAGHRLCHGSEVFINFAGGRKFTNIFQIVVAPPGTGKTTGFSAVRKVAGDGIEVENERIPSMASPHAMIDIFAEGSCRILYEDEGNPVVSYWGERGNGQLVANQMLALYDETTLYDAFRRNKDGKAGSPSRVAENCVASVALGITYRQARMGNVDARDGLHRRFGYYFSEGNARTLTRPGEMNRNELGRMRNRFERLDEMSGEMDFSPDALVLWEDIQNANRRKIAAVDPFTAEGESTVSALRESPSRIMKLAMIFECCRAAHRGEETPAMIEAGTLQCAEKHQDACEKSIAMLNSAMKGREIREKAEKLVADIWHGGRIKGEWNENGNLYGITKSMLTSAFCNNPSRSNALTTEDLYGDIMPYLERAGYCHQLPKKGKREAWAFHPEDEDRRAYGAGEFGEFANQQP